MAVKIRLARGGSKKRPFYRIVATDIRSPRDSSFIEKLGTYNPLLAKDSDERFTFKEERIKYWLSKGAQPTETVKRYLVNAGIMEYSAKEKAIKDRAIAKHAEIKAAADKKAAEEKAAKDAEEAAAKAEEEKAAKEAKEAEKAAAAEKPEEPKAEEPAADEAKAEEPKAEAEAEKTE